MTRQSSRSPFASSRGGRGAFGGSGGATQPLIGALVLDNASIAENSAPSVVVGNLSTTAPGSTFLLIDDAQGRFALANGNQIVTGAVNLNYVEGSTWYVKVRVFNGLAALDEWVRITVTQVPITNITLSNASVPSGSAANVVVGALASVPAGATLTLTDTGGGCFKIVGSNLETTSTATNKAVNATVNVTVRADEGGETFSKTFTITIS